MTIWLKILIVASGGAFGAVVRFLLGELMTARFTHPHFGTLCANLIGCLLFGVFRGAVDVSDWGSDALRLFIFTGFLGALTTFSTFKFDIVTLWETNKFATCLYIGTSLIGGLTMYGVGWWATAKIAS